MAPNVQGALLMMGSMAAFTFNDALVKLVGQGVPLGQIITLRGALATVLIAGLAWSTGHLRVGMTRQDAVLVGLRCLSEAGATWFFLTALLNMPLANVTAILQILPLTVTLGAALFFREHVGWRRSLAIGLGFCGMLLIVRPGAEEFEKHAVYALLAVACVTCRDLVTRRISGNVPSLTVTLIASASVFVLASLASISGEWVPLDPRQAIMIGSASVFILLGYLFSVMVMRVGDVSFVAPFRYTGLLWALLLGWLAFGHWPDAVTLVGAAIVVVAGLFTLFRGRRKGA